MVHGIKGLVLKRINPDCHINRIFRLCEVKENVISSSQFAICKPSKEILGLVGIETRVTLESVMSRMFHMCTLYT